MRKPSVSDLQDRVHLSNSAVLGGLFFSARMKRIFSDSALVQSWLDAEVGLARGQADVGVIPAAAAEAIAAAAHAVDFDLDEMGREVMATAHPLVPIIREFSKAAGVGGAYVHLGATTQDITDTGLVLQTKAGLELVDTLLRELIDLLAGLALEHRDLAMVGRTHAQHALPITLGLKFAVILSECERHVERLENVRSRVLVGQLGGAVGSMAALGPDGFAVQERMNAHLGLATPDVPWHTARDGFAETVSILAMVSATCGKIANEIRVLQRTEVAELEEPFTAGKVGSSTMPHKRNPMFAEFMIANAILAREKPASMLAAMLQEHERDMSMWGVEWTVVPDSFQLSAGLLERSAFLLRGLIVHPENIHRNLHQLGDLMLSEVAMMALARDLGKSEAHEVVYRASMKAWDSGSSLTGLLLEDVAVTESSVDGDELASLMVPEKYVGASPELVDRALARTRLRKQREDAERAID
ncbi:MAG: 3-carboxy-cis,cis-muconate cycloisomerase [Subtercola sp.]|jgi:3-carboxy-cis,cis-muconate cycloisomerase|nr:3-carboxy-cis,cis-muconate cycloisomerase [Subtercola sp.]